MMETTINDVEDDDSGRKKTKSATNDDLGDKWWKNLEEKYENEEDEISGYGWWIWKEIEENELGYVSVFFKLGIK